MTTMSDRAPTRWQNNRRPIYPHPINPCVYTYDLICHLQISIKITILNIILPVVKLIDLNLCDYCMKRANLKACFL